MNRGRDEAGNVPQRVLIGAICTVSEGGGLGRAQVGWHWLGLRPQLSLSLQGSEAGTQHRGKRPGTYPVMHRSLPQAAPGKA